MSSEARERALLRAAGGALARAWRAVSAQVGVQEVTLYGGLALLGAGLWQLSPAAGLAVPGAVLVWAALPQRPPLVQPRPRDRREV